MIDDTLNEIEANIHEAKSISEERKKELLQLLGTLKAEVGKLSENYTEQAQSITGFAQVSTHEATRTQRNQQSLEHSLGGLRSSVEGFEKTHPQLVAIVNNISNFLSNLGI